MPKIIPKITNDECPFCGSHDIYGGYVTTASNRAWQKATCIPCGRNWRENYVLESIQYDDEDGKAQKIMTKQEENPKNGENTD